MRFILIPILILLSIQAFSQENQIILKGTISSVSTDEPIPFASVHIYRTMTGTITDDQGKFELKVESSRLSDTLIFSCVGYKQFRSQIVKLSPKNNLRIELEDSLFLLQEVIALCYDNIEALKWNSKKNNKAETMLSFATRELQNAANYISITKEHFGEGKMKTNFYKWKKVKISGVPDKVDFTISWFKCPYCPDPNNITVTISVTDRNGKNLVESPAYKKILINYFQSLLDKTFAQGVDQAQLEERMKVMYLKKGSTPYTGQCYGYYDSGQKGLRGNYTMGLKDGFWEYWYSNGQKKIEGNYKKGLKSGAWTYWYSSGQVRIQATYIEDEMDGVNIWYHENGQKKKEARFKNGVYLDKTEWDEKGNVINATQFLH
jgi:antitoxin component YwqK of YwqJK toxin-antitoxin module